MHAAEAIPLRLTNKTKVKILNIIKVTILGVDSEYRLIRGRKLTVRGAQRIFNTINPNNIVTSIETFILS